MDAIRKEMDELLGKDRDLPLKIKQTMNKHFDTPEVCKFFLLDFCPHDLFPNTKNDLGPCKKRHDYAFMYQFLNNPNKEQYKIRYEEELSDFLKELIGAVDQKMKKGQERIEAPLPDSEKPRDILEQIDNCDAKVKKLVIEAERLGELAMIDEVEKTMAQIEKYMHQKAELSSMLEHPLLLKEKQMKI